MEYIERDVLNNPDNKGHCQPEDWSPMNVFRQMREDRKWYKNVRIHRTGWPTQIVKSIHYRQAEATDFEKRILDRAVSATSQSSTQAFRSHEPTSPQFYCNKVQPLQKPVALFVKEVLGKIANAEIGMSLDEITDESLADLGVDSLMALTMASALTEELEVPVSLWDIQKQPTLTELATYLINLLSETPVYRTDSS